jgi:hypothetical protein
LFLLAVFALASVGCSDSGDGDSNAEGGGTSTEGGDTSGEGGDASGEGGGDTTEGGDASGEGGEGDAGSDASGEGGDTVSDTSGEGGDTSGEGGDTIDPPDTSSEGGDADAVLPDTSDEGGDADIADPDTSEEGGGPATGYPSSELNLSIIGPSAQEVGQSLGKIVPVTGLLFGHADTIVWEHLGTGDSGEIAVKAFWQSDGIQLEQGDNPIRVTASNAETGAQSSDEINVAYNPAFLFDLIPTARPNVVFVGSSTEVLINAKLGLYTNFDPTTVQLWITDEEGNPVEKKNLLQDNGNTASSCDEVDKDAVYSTCLTVNPAKPGRIQMRISAEVANVFEKYTAWSPVFFLEAVSPVTNGECNERVGILQAARGSYDDKIATMSPAEARQAVIAELLANDAVQEAGEATEGYGIWIAFEGGLLGALNLSPAGYRGGPGQVVETGTSGASSPPLSIGSKRASVLAPFNAEFGALDEAEAIAATLKDVGCPFFDVSYQKGAKADLFQFRHANEAGIFAVTSHGDATFKGLSAEVSAAYSWEHDGSQEVLWTGEAVDCSKFSSSYSSCNGGGTVCGNGIGECVLGKSNKCVDFKHSDLRTGRVVLSDTTYGILPSFVSHHAKTRKFPKSLVYLGSCRGLFNGGFAAAYFGNGARAVVGYDDYVKSEFAFERGTAFFDELINEASEAGPALGDTATHEDPGNVGSFVRLFGAPNLSASDYSIVNQSWETGDATAWTAAGDGRVITALGATIPVHGKFMGLISTGLGFTQQTGELKQKFCIAPDKTSVSLYWKYYSEEFLEFCGSSFQDAFQATLQNSTGKITMVDVKVDTLCPPGQCGGCGGNYVGLTPSDVSFDVGGVYNTTWQEATANISALAGTGPVTLTLFTTDAGDSIYDTVVLIDNVEFK